jgi:hypothetical protein
MSGNDFWEGFGDFLLSDMRWTRTRIWRERRRAPWIGERIVLSPVRVQFGSSSRGTRCKTICRLPLATAESVSEEKIAEDSEGMDEIKELPEDASKPTERLPRSA